jgi:hypothetical protein
VALADLPAQLTLEETAELMRIPVLEAHRAAAAGELPLVRGNGRWFVDSWQLLQELGVSLRDVGAPGLVRVPGRVSPGEGKRSCSKDAS